MGRKRSVGNERLGEYVHVRSGGMLELRYPIPGDVAYAFPRASGPRRLLIHSLGTRDPKLGNAKADQLRVSIRNEISKLRAASGSVALSEFLVQIYEAELQDFRTQIANAARDRQLARLDGSSLEALKINRARANRVDYGKALLSDDFEEQIATAGWAADYFFEKNKWPIDRASPRYKQIVRQCASMLADANIAKNDIDAGQEPSAPIGHALLNAVETRRAPAKSSKNAIADEGALSITAYFDKIYSTSNDHVTAPRAGERNIGGKRHSVQIFSQIMGDLQIADITKGKLYDFLDEILKLPDSRKLPGNLKNVSAREILKRVEDGSLKLPAISPKTANKHLSNISSILDFAERRRHIDKADARGVKVRFEDTEDAGRPFTAAELNRIFALPLFTGCMGENVAGGLFKPGSVKIRDDRFWIPLLLLFTGGRSSEIVGLETADVVLDHEVPHLLISPNSTRPRLKNRHSRRMVPIHSRLLDLGFAQFVKARIKGRDQRLFPMAGTVNYQDASYGKAQRGLSAALIMRQFNRTHLQHADADGNGGSIKCFRNSFEQEAASKIPSDEVRQRLTGRKVASTARIYTNNIPPDPDQRKAQLKRLKGEIELVTYDFLDLSQIKP